MALVPSAKLIAQWAGIASMASGIGEPPAPVRFGPLSIGESAGSEVAEGLSGGEAACAPGSVADDLAGAGSRASRLGSISGNPANRLIETGKPLKNGEGWVRRWIRITPADELAQRQAIANRYGELAKEATKQGLTGNARRKFLFEQMSQFRTEWLKNFLKNRKY